jgi:hypothetical protein
MSCGVKKSMKLLHFFEVRFIIYLLACRQQREELTSLVSLCLLLSPSLLRCACARRAELLALFMPSMFAEACAEEGGDYQVFRDHLPRLLHSAHPA